MADNRKFLNGSIGLTRLNHVLLEKKGKGGKLVKGVFLPLDVNHFETVEYEDKEGNKVTEIVLNVRVVYNPDTDPKTKQNGFIAKSLPSDVYKEHKDDTTWLNNNQPILGNIKDFSSTSAAPVNAAAGDKDVYSDEDDLPF